MFILELQFGHHIVVLSSLDYLS